MGTDRTFYVGPMVKCEPYITIIRLSETYCPNGCESYKLFNVGKFCKDCGFKIEEREREVESSEPDSCEIEPVIDERLSKIALDESGFDYWVPNVNYGSISRVMVRSYNELRPTPIALEEISNDLEKFKVFFAKELVILGEEYRGKIEVIWGVSSWSS